MVAPYDPHCKYSLVCRAILAALCPAASPVLCTPAFAACELVYFLLFLFICKFHDQDYVSIKLPRSYLEGLYCSTIALPSKLIFTEAQQKGIFKAENKSEKNTVHCRHRPALLEGFSVPPMKSSWPNSLELGKGFSPRCILCFLWLINVSYRTFLCLFLLPGSSQPGFEADWGFFAFWLFHFYLLILLFFLPSLYYLAPIFLLQISIIQ